MPRVAFYARVSTSEQHLSPQLDALRTYASARGFEVAGEYVDEGVSGAKGCRPALDRLLRDARRRWFDAVACVKLDRLARSVRHLTAMAAEFDALGVGLLVLDQAIDTTTPAGRLLFHTLAAVAEFERDLIRERVNAGILAARRRGVRFGRPVVLNAAQRARARRLAAHGHSQRAIAAQLGASKSVVARALIGAKATSPTA